MANNPIVIKQRIGSVANSTGGTATASITVPAAGCDVGNTVIVKVAIQVATPPAISSITDSRGNTYTVDKDVSLTPLRTSIASAPITTALVSGDTITITFASNFNRLSAYADEIKGLYASTVSDQTASGSGSGAGSISLTPSSVLAQEYELVAVAAGGVVAGDPITSVSVPSGGFVRDTVQQSGGTSPASIAGLYYPVNSTAIPTVTYARASALQNAGVMCTYRGYDNGPSWQAAVATSFNTTGVTTGSVTLPASNAGDVMILGMETSSGSGGAVPTLPSGWTAVTDENPAGGMRVFTKVCDGTEGTSMTVTWAAPGSNRIVIHVVLFRGIDNGAVVEVHGENAISGTGNHTVPSITTASDGTFIILFRGQGGTNVSISTAVTTYIKDLNTALAGVGSALNTDDKWTSVAGSYGAEVWSSGASTVTGEHCIIAFTPAPLVEKNTGTATFSLLEKIVELNSDNSATGTPSISPDRTSEAGASSGTGSQSIPTDATAEIDTSSATSTQSMDETIVGGSNTIEETVDNQGTATITILSAQAESLAQSQLNTPSLIDPDSGETNVLTNLMQATFAMQDIVVADFETMGTLGTATLTLLEAVAESPRNVGTNTQDLFFVEEALGNSGTATITIDDIANGSIAETIDATFGDSELDVGYHVSGLNIPSIIEIFRMTLVDLTAPTLEAIYFLDNTVTLVYSEELDPASLPSAGAFTVEKNGSSLSINDVSIDLNQVIIEVVGLDAFVGQIVALCAIYTVPGVDPLQDAAGNQAFSFDLCQTTLPPDGEGSGNPPVVIGPPPPSAGNGGSDGSGTGGTSGPSFGARGISLHMVRFRASQKSFKLAGMGGGGIGGSGGSSVSGGGGQTGDWSPGTPPGWLVPFLILYAPNLTYPDSGSVIKATYGLANCVPSDPYRQYFASIHDNGQIFFHDGHKWIHVKFRDPPNSGNTIEIRID